MARLHLLFVFNLFPPTPTTTSPPPPSPLRDEPAAPAGERDGPDRQGVCGAGRRRRTLRGQGQSEGVHHGSTPEMRVLMRHPPRGIRLVASASCHPPRGVRLVSSPNCFFRRCCETRIDEISFNRDCVVSYAVTSPRTVVALVRRMWSFSEDGCGPCPSFSIPSHPVPARPLVIFLLFQNGIIVEWSRRF